MRFVLFLLLLVGCASEVETVSNKLEPLDAPVYRWGIDSPTVLTFRAPVNCDYIPSEKLNPWPAIEGWNAIAPIQMVGGDSLYVDLEVREYGWIDADWLGASQVWLDEKDEVTKAIIYVNVVRLEFEYTDLPNAKQHVVCHEVGRVFGAMPTTESGLCMNDCSEAQSREEWNHCMDDLRGTLPSPSSQLELQALYEAPALEPVDDAGVEDETDPLLLHRFMPYGGE